jgi:predicted nuclease with TOPRIM domain
VKEKNKDLEQQLERRSGHLERLIKEKEKEKNELVKTLETKEGEYKQLQNMLERLKEDHEDRHARLKGNILISRILKPPLFRDNFYSTLFHNKSKECLNYQ